MMPKPTVSRRYRNEEVNLQPYGNTISVETPSDNPFESAQDVEVFTQMSGGMAGPDRAMQSKRKVRGRTTGMTPDRKPMAAGIRSGYAAGRRFNAPAHLQHSGFVPGLGADTAPAPTNWQTAAGAVGQAASTAAQVIGTRYATKAEEARARAAEAQAQAEAAITERSRMMAMLDTSMANMGQHKTLVFGLLGVGALALGAAFILKKRKGGGSRRRR